MRPAHIMLAILAAVGCTLRPDDTLWAREEVAAQEPARPALLAQTGGQGVLSVAFSPDGKTALSGGFDDTVRLWEVETGRVIRRFEGHTEKILSVAYSADGGRVLTAGRDDSVRLWETATGRELQRFPVSNSHWKSICSPVALSSDGAFLLTAAEGSATLWDTETASEIRRFEGHSTHIASVAFSPDGTQVLTGSWDRTVRLWETKTAREVRRLEGHDGTVHSVAFSPDGDLVLTGSRDGTARLWEPTTGREVRKLETRGDSVYSVAFMRDGSQLLTVSGPNIQLWATETGKEVHRLMGIQELGALYDPDALTGALAVALSPDGTQILTGTSDVNAMRMWETATGREIRCFEGRARKPRSLALSPEGTQVLISLSPNDAVVRLVDLLTGREIRQFIGHTEIVRALAFSPDGLRVATGSDDMTMRLWDRATGSEVHRFEGLSSGIEAVAFTPDGRHIVAGTMECMCWWDTETGEEVLRVPGWVNALAISQDGKHLLTSSKADVEHGPVLWEAVTDQEIGRFRAIRRFVGHDRSMQAVAFAPNGTHVLSGSRDRTARLWETATGREIRRFVGHRGLFTAVAFTSDGAHVVTASTDGTVRFWDTATGQETCSWVFFGDGTWAVVAPDGRFDTSDLDEVRGLHWVMPDDPLHALSIEIFMRDYYEPRLLPRLLANETFSPVQDISQLNRVQPEVRIVAVEPHAERPGGVEVTVEVKSQRRRMAGPAGDVERLSGAEDLRLFRNGRLVAWRDGRLELDSAGEARITLKDVRLPAHAQEAIVFSAYAFNKDRVKSRTTTFEYGPHEGDASRRGKAYVVAVGIDAFDVSHWDLAYAAADARALTTTLTANLRKTATFADVIPVLLTSEADAEGRRTHDGARRKDVETTLRILAGRPVDTRARARIPGGKRLQPAQPGDLVILAFSTHGVAAKGDFYLLPSDVQPSDAGGAWLSSCIAAEELSAWLRPIDAEMAMVVDACQSAASVEKKGFKPGPMGSRGLGQLAWSKRMRILTASQSAQFALESGALRQGLLTYALVQDGLSRHQADHEPADGRITLSEWFRYGESRVPRLVESIARGALPVITDRGPLRVSKSRPSPPITQTPALFDFTRGQRDVVIAEPAGSK